MAQDGAYNRPEYEEALTALEQLHGELEERNQSAAGSLEEGLEETLTLHRLGVHAVLGRSFKTTNCLELFLKLFPRYAGRARRGATVAGDNLRGTAVVVENAPKSLSRHDGASVIRACRQRCDELVAETLVVPFCTARSSPRSRFEPAVRTPRWACRSPPAAQGSEASPAA